MLQTILLVFHILIAIALIAIILLQQGRGATAGAAFGGGASGTVFGARGSTSFLSRTTSILATLFLGNCLLLAYLSSEQAAPLSIGQQLQQQTAAPAPSPASSDAPTIPTASPAAPAPAATPAPDEAASAASAPVAAPADLPQIPANGAGQQ